ncbi:MAG: tRNA-dihydrouridine synthase [Synergistes sp.]|nr:tRNA-dihydrouridine synthase [Synergistes sp.]
MKEIQSQNKTNSAVIPGFPREIGGVNVENNIWLAPLAGITFASFRRFHRAMGAGLVHTEMVSALGLKYKGRKTKELLFGSDDEAPCVLQLFGANEYDITTGAEVALGIRNFAALEVNMACPMPKVTKKGSGSKLMEEPDESANIVKSLKRFNMPVWVKTRIMPCASEISTEDFCEKLFAAGCDFIFLHGRTPQQRYEGAADSVSVEKIARKFKDKIGGSGDCYAPQDMIRYLEGGCASVLAARGVLRDVYLIPRTLARLGADISQSLCSPDAESRIRMLLQLGENIYNNEGEGLALTIAKRMLCAIFKGFSGAAQLRQAGAMTKSWAEMTELLLRERMRNCPLLP